MTAAAVPRTVDSSHSGLCPEVTAAAVPGHSTQVSLTVACALKWLQLQFPGQSTQVTVACALKWLQLQFPGELVNHKGAQETDDRVSFIWVPAENTPLLQHSHQPPIGVAETVIYLFIVGL